MIIDQERLRHEVNQAERLVRVEEGVDYLKESMGDVKKLLQEHVDEPCDFNGCALKDDVNDLLVTQKWAQWLSKTVIGTVILGAFGLFIKGAIYIGTKM